MSASWVEHFGVEVTQEIADAALKVTGWEQTQAGIGVRLARGTRIHEEHPRAIARALAMGNEAEADRLRAEVVQAADARRELPTASEFAEREHAIALGRLVELLLPAAQARSREVVEAFDVAAATTRAALARVLEEEAIYRRMLQAHRHYTNSREPTAGLPGFARPNELGRWFRERIKHHDGLGAS